jgi:hypothetical protein
LHERYALPDADKLTAKVRAAACIGAIRAALSLLFRHRTDNGLPTGAFHDALEHCFAALSATPGTNIDPGGQHGR